MTALAVLVTVAEVQSKAVFAHYMVGSGSDREAQASLTPAIIGWDHIWLSAE